MGSRQPNRAQRVVVVVALAAALGASGQWLTSLGSRPDFGWVAYAPLSNRITPDGLHPWVQLLIWLALIIVWAFVGVALLRTDIPRGGPE
jgi:heme/copper-type cytochrome/quinol oxidase subunit 1